MISRYLVILFMFLLCLPMETNAGREKSFALCFKPAEAGFQELDLPDRVYEKLVGHPGVDIATPQKSDSIIEEHPAFANEHFQPNLMIEMASLISARYMIWLKVVEAGVRESGHTIIPYLFKSHHRKYVLGVQMFIIDSFTGKTIISKFFESKKKGPAVLSCLDFDPNDPGLVTKYSAVKRKFNEMEMEISEKIVREVVKVIRRR